MNYFFLGCLAKKKRNMMDSFSLQCEKDLLNVDDTATENASRPIISVAHVYDADAKCWGISIRGIEHHCMREISDKLSEKTGCKFRMVNGDIVFQAKLKPQLPSMEILFKFFKKRHYIPTYKCIHHRTYDKFR
jgi:hypothetical protein